MQRTVFCHFGPFLPFDAPNNPKIFWRNKKACLEILSFYIRVPQMISYDAWFLRYRPQQTEFLVISGYFLPFYPNNPENQNFEKIKKTPGGIIILNMSKNHIWCMIPEIWSTTDKIFLILDHFLPFYTPLSAPLPPNNSENPNFEKKKKKHHVISSLYTSVPKNMIICYTVPEIWHMTHVIVIFHFGLFFALF